MIHLMTLRPLPFSLIKAKKKVVEMRLNDEKRQLIKVGDTLSFENTDTHEIIYCEVTGKRSFSTFKEVYEFYKPAEIGYEENSKPDYHDMNEYYSDEKIARNGVLAIEIKLIEK